MNPAVSALIDLEAFRSNLEAFRRRIPPATRMCPAVKADGYGHGVALLLPVLQETQTEALCVAQLHEALEVRRLGWRRAVLCLGAPLVGDSAADSRERAAEAVAGGIECTISSRHELDQIATASRAIGRRASVHIKVDTGMGRMGMPPDRVPELVAVAAGSPDVAVAGIYSHLATADEADASFAREQIGRLSQVLATIRTAGFPVECFHIANSAAICRIPGAAFDMVRPGLGIYGYWAGPLDERPNDLRPILRVVSRLAAVRKISKDHSVGYGRQFVAARDTVSGVIPIGYADGYRRALSGQGIITINERRGAPRALVPVIGRVSMDQICVDLTDVPDVQPGDRVTIMDRAVDAPNSIEAIARQIGTIPYEITCGLGTRVHRVADDGRQTL